jgi:uncharacterized coiled-coil protein SlyX
VTPLMAGDTVAAIATVVAALIAMIGGYVSVHGSKRMKALETAAALQAASIEAQTIERGQSLTNQQNITDQLQEDVTGLRAELAAIKIAHASEIAGIRVDLAASQKRERAVEGYAWDLRRYIERGEGPPPPPWPPELEHSA